MNGSFWRMWGWPIVLGVLTTSGLLAALLSEGWGDIWSWFGLGVPVAIMGWHSSARTGRKEAEPGA